MHDNSYLSLKKALPWDICIILATMFSVFSVGFVTLLILISKGGLGHLDSVVISARNILANLSPPAGWTFHGIYSYGYLLKDPIGNWIKLKDGDFVEGLGAVHGVNKNRHLIIGGYILKNSRPEF